MMLPVSILRQVKEIEEDSSSGAEELALKSINIIEDTLNWVKDPNENIKGVIFELAAKLLKARPSMAPLINLIGYVISSAQNYTKNSLSAAIQAYHQSNAAKKKQLVNNFEKFLVSTNLSEPTIMSISYSSTILSLISEFNEIPFAFYILESRPLCEGQKVAKKLSEKHETHLIVDAAMGIFIENIDLVLIGVDSVLKSGSIVNKIGTYPLAVLAKSVGKPVYAIGDSFKYNLRSHYNLPVEIIEKPKDEVLKTNASNLRIENYYFDITPAKYIDGIISDLGVLSVSEFLDEVKCELPVNWFADFINSLR